MRKNHLRAGLLLHLPYTLDTLQKKGFVIRAARGYGRRAVIVSGINRVGGEQKRFLLSCDLHSQKAGGVAWQPQQPYAGEKLRIPGNLCHLSGQLFQILPDIAAPPRGIFLTNQAASCGIVFCRDDQTGMGKKLPVTGVVQMQMGKNHRIDLRWRYAAQL